MNVATHNLNPRAWDWLYAGAYLWLALPLLLFVTFWLRPLIAVPLALAIVAALIALSSTTAPEHRGLLRRHRAKIAVCAAVIALWVIMTGIGGYMFQDVWDHQFRNAIFRDLSQRPWPVTATGGGGYDILCYYFGFWLVPASVAKLTGSIEIGYAAQAIYAFIGVMLTLLMTFRYLGAVKFITLVIFVMVGCWEWVGSAYTNHSIKWFLINMTFPSFQYFGAFPLSNQLYYVYNQAIGSWLVIMLTLKHRDNPGVTMMLFAFMMLFSPFAAIGMAPWVAYLLVRGKLRSLTWVNVVGLAVTCIIASFYMANDRSHERSLMTFDSAHVTLYVLMIISTFGVYLPFVWRQVKHDSTFLWLTLPLLPMLWLQFGDHNDFTFRCTVPAAFYMMLLVMRRANEVTSWRKPRAIVFAAVLVLGAVSTVDLIAIRTYQGFKYEMTTRTDVWESTYDIPYLRANFIGNSDCFFTRYLMRQSSTDTR